MNKKNIILAIFSYTIFPVSSVIMKFAANCDNIIYKMLLFGLSIGVLVIFSILWQKLLKNVDLVKAYIFKSTTIIWNVIYGIILFGEKISVNMAFGMIIVTVGVITTILGGKCNE